MKLWHIMPKEVYDKTIGINKPYICDIFKSKYISRCILLDGKSIKQKNRQP